MPRTVAPRSAPQPPIRIALLTYESPQAKYMIHQLMQAFPSCVVGIMKSSRIVSGKGIVESIWFLLMKTGLGFVLPKTAEILMNKWVSLLSPFLDKKRRNVGTLRQLCANQAIPFVMTDNVNSKASRAILESWAPDIILSVYLNQRVRAKLLNIPRNGVLNAHPALLPRYKGLFPFFWVLAKGEKETGMTVHWMDETFDTGEIILQERIEITPTDTVLTISVRNALQGARMLVDTVQKIMDGTATSYKQTDMGGEYYSWPTREAIRELRARGRKYATWKQMWRVARGNFSLDEISND